MFSLEPKSVLSGSVAPPGNSVHWGKHQKSWRRNHRSDIFSGADRAGGNR